MRRTERTLQFDEYLEGLDYPTRKEEIIRHAKDKEAPQDLINKLEFLPDHLFKEERDVREALGITNGGGLRRDFDEPSEHEPTR